MFIHTFGKTEKDAERYAFIFEALSLNSALNLDERARARAFGKLQDKVEAIGTKAGARDNQWKHQFYACENGGRLSLQDLENELLVEAVKTYKVMPLGIRRREEIVEWLEASKVLTEKEFAHAIQPGLAKKDAKVAGSIGKKAGQPAKAPDHSE